MANRRNKEKPNKATDELGRSAIIKHRSICRLCGNSKRRGECIISLPKPEIIYREMKIELKTIEKHADEGEI